uniref:NADH-ubiquinone oxidoreductase chain 3 n=1 Tax=Trachelus iudaicus TaxID=1090881 RepID=A0A1J0KGP5_9HYME|nr:NADH dehydrogenase subunit 3 [Trachelus iudaicus]APC92667.1 NADH dehydrogenase subunit 3 [Trachelus iudaicus]
MFMMMYMFTACLILTMIMMSINMIISKKKMTDREKSSPFECGFDPLSSTRTPFSLRFYLISIIFLIFDIEIVILFPLIPSTWFSNPMIWIMMFLIFSIMLIWGVILEWNDGSLYWMK